MQFVGIDVGSKELVAVAIVKGKAHKAQSFQNDAEGHLALINKLGKTSEPVRVCLEATGGYHFDVAVALSKTANVEVMVVNPKASKHFAEALMLRQAQHK